MIDQASSDLLTAVKTSVGMVDVKTSVGMVVREAGKKNQQLSNYRSSVVTR